MKRITIAVGSKRGPKLSAVTEALQSFSATLAHAAEFDVVGVEVESGVSHTPTSRGELMRGARQRGRSEEHTSELQSPCNLVCRLLLEKKKKIKNAMSNCCRHC